MIRAIPVENDSQIVFLTAMFPLEDMTFFCVEITGTVEVCEFVVEP